MPCVSGQGQNLSQGLGQVGLERQGLTCCQGPNVGGVTPQNERMQEILRMTQGLDPEVETGIRKRWNIPKWI